MSEKLIDIKDNQQGRAFCSFTEENSLQRLSMDLYEENFLINNEKNKEALVLGCAIGDGFMRRRQLVIQHCEKQKPYLLYKKYLLEELFKQEVAVGTTKGKIDGKVFPGNRLYFNNSLVSNLRQDLYKEGKKCISRKVLDKLNNLSLAIWYQDDGSLVLHKEKESGKIKSREIYLSTESFSYEENQTIVGWFKEKYGIVAKIYNNSGFNKKTGKAYHRIALNATNANKLLDIVSPYIHSSMSYKGNMLYVR